MSRLIVGVSWLFLVAGCATAGGPPGSSTTGGASDAPPRDPVFLAAEIEGKAGDELDALLGAPDLVRLEGAGEFRRYMLADCALMIILYPDDKGTKRTAKIDAGALSVGDDKPDLDRCLARGKAKPA